MAAKLAIRELEQYFRATEHDVVCAYLFGSQARGDAHADSDVDVAVLLPEDVDRGPFGVPGRIRGELERLLRRRVEVIDLRAASPDLIHRILRDGHLLVDRDPDGRVRFEVHARNLYFDVLPYLQEYRRYRAA